jgi:hypothetical protein
VAFLGCASIGAVWSACAQDYSAAGATVRFGQLEPAVLVAADGYRWNGQALDRRGEVAELRRGTDVASGFAGSSPVTPVYAGEISAPLLGVALETWDDAGRPVSGQVGELVITRPMRSMPLRFWDDPDGERYRDAYFARWPGAWRHGDWAEITVHGGVIVSGRSDATLNRQGVRLGSADIYTAIEAIRQAPRSPGQAADPGAAAGGGGQPGRRGRLRRARPVHRLRRRPPGLSEEPDSVILRAGFPSSAATGAPKHVNYPSCIVSYTRCAYSRATRRSGGIGGST